jgi:hypothetical protein
MKGTKQMDWLPMKGTKQMDYISKSDNPVGKIRKLMLRRCSSG